ncbi:MAG: T9SS type A sorting domain-containing protein [Melioribacteraceae bacterium]|nr:T9SS type A sorting domain-containing protein [Melioribacteraceae bacterium]
MIPKKLHLLLVTIFIASTLLSQNSLYVNDPQATWRNYRGNIEEAVISVGQRGLYSQVSMYLTFSADPNYYIANSQLEVVMNFNLPAGSLITDLWLWLDDTKISKGALLDTWTASAIYESIVNRRRDPALLRRMWENNYELRVYPMKPNETRKVRVTYLVPNIWTNSSVSVPLPVQILKTSNKKIPKVQVKSWTENEWTSLSAANITGVFNTIKDDFFGNHRSISFDNYQSVADASLDFNNPMVNGVYLKIFKENDQGFYQLSILPSNSLSTLKKNVLFLIDYDSRKSNVTRTEVVNSLKNFMKNNFGEGDKFNIFYSGLTIGKVNSDWMDGTSQKVEEVFNTFSPNSISTYSNLPTLLKEGYEYLLAKKVGIVFLISNSDQLGSNTTANQVITDLRKISSILPATHILDYNDKDFSYYYFNNRSYTGNEYFYENLSRISGGQFARATSSLTASMNSIGGNLSGSVSSFDLYTTLENGFCFSRQTLTGNLQSMAVNTIIKQVGKYIGDFPFLVKTSGIYNSQPFTQSVMFQDEIARVGDNTISQMWAGHYINELEKLSQNNSTVSEIINYSRAFRVLSRYTAFLSVEDDSAICHDCYKDGGGQNTDVEEEVIPTEFSLTAYPNPFNPQTTITIKLPNNMVASEMSFKIYNVLGQVIKSFSVDELGNSKVINLNWNGISDSGERVASGIYLFTVSGKNFTKTLKLMLMK